MLRACQKFPWRLKAFSCARVRLPGCTRRLAGVMGKLLDAIAGLSTASGRLVRCILVLPGRTVQRPTANLSRVDASGLQPSVDASLADASLSLTSAILSPADASGSRTAAIRSRSSATLSLVDAIGSRPVAARVRRLQSCLWLVQACRCCLQADDRSSAVFPGEDTAEACTSFRLATQKTGPHLVPTSSISIRTWSECAAIRASFQLRARF
jgi:hypothetical protein